MSKKESEAFDLATNPAFLKLKEENKRLRRKLTTVGAGGELLIQAVDESLGDYEAPPPPKPPRKSRRKTPVREVEAAVCHLSDTQIGKITPSYDSEIAAARIMEYGQRVAKCITRHRRYAEINEIHLYLGGDMVEGELIFPSQAHLIDQSVFDQAVRTGPEAIHALVLFWLGVVDKIHVTCVPGNHGRPAGKHAPSHPRSNWDRVFYHTARMLIMGHPNRPQKDVAGRVTWKEAETFFAVNEVMGHRHLIVHGDQIRGGHAGIPWYGIAKKAQGWIDSIGEPWDHLFFGHFHTYTDCTLNHRRWFCNGTTESDNEYAQEQLAACGKPVQRLQFWNRRYGLVADRPIYLTYGLQ